MTAPVYIVDVQAIVRDGNGWTDYGVWCQRRPELESYPPCVDWTVTVSGPGVSQEEIGFLILEDHDDRLTLVAHRSTYRNYYLNGPTHVAGQWGIDGAPTEGELAHAGKLLFDLWSPPWVEVMAGTARQLREKRDR